MELRSDVIVVSLFKRMDEFVKANSGSQGYIIFTMFT